MPYADLRSGTTFDGGHTMGTLLPETVRRAPMTAVSMSTRSPYVNNNTSDNIVG